MKVYNEYFTNLIKKLKSILHCYFEEAIADENMYGLICNINENKITKEYQIFFDIEIYIKDIDNASELIENKCDELIEKVDNMTLNYENIRSYLYFDGRNTINDTSGELIARRLSFVSKIFKK